MPQCVNCSCWRQSRVQKIYARFEAYCGCREYKQYNRESGYIMNTLADYRLLVHEVIVDSQFINNRFADKGGITRFNKVLNNQLDDVLEELREHLWDAV